MREMRIRMFVFFSVFYLLRSNGYWDLRLSLSHSFALSLTGDVGRVSCLRSQLSMALVCYLFWHNYVRWQYNQRFMMRSTTEQHINMRETCAFWIWMLFNWKRISLEWDSSHHIRDLSIGDFYIFRTGSHIFLFQSLIMHLFSSILLK